MQKLLMVIMDGVGESESDFGNAVRWGMCPYMNYLRKHHPFTQLKAHGKAVGLPSDQDMGNSEVGHNALGSGQIYDQGAKLIDQALTSGVLFQTSLWKELVCRPTLHFLGLLSDGKVHSHEDHLYHMLKKAAQDGAKRLRVHVLLDGRDVAETSAEVYVHRLEKVLADLRAGGCDAKVASGGGRMTTTMDRYEADWSMVERGWQVHVRGQGAGFPSLIKAIEHFRNTTSLTDQYLPSFVVVDQSGKPIGPIESHHGVVLFNYRGDRALQITRAFEEGDAFKNFDRSPKPQDILFTGMMQYDGDAALPKRFLVSPPAIRHSLGEHLAHLGIRQFACSETQKFGHVTYFWNGNRSGLFDPNTELYLEIPSDSITFDCAPWMKAKEITDATLAAMAAQRFDFGRINFANGDMVGHTGHFQASILAVSTVDLMLGRLMAGARAFGYTLLITADHGNCEEMFDAKPSDYPQWKHTWMHTPLKPKTSHTLSPVPCFLYEPSQTHTTRTFKTGGGLANLANTVLQLMGLPPQTYYQESLLGPHKLCALSAQ